MGHFGCIILKISPQQTAKNFLAGYKTRFYAQMYMYKIGMKKKESDY